MSPRLRFLIHFSFLLALLGTGPMACKGKAPEGATVAFQTEHFEKTFQDCKPDSPDCAHVKMEYPKFTGGTTPEALNKLNQRVRIFLISPIYDIKTDNIEDLTKTFFDEFGKFKKEFPDAPGGWQVERTVGAKQLSPQILTLDMSEYSFTGGAHPNGFEQFLNMNPATGEAYSLNDVLIPGSENKLTQVAEEIFRKQQKLGPKENLGEAGYFFKDDKFYLNNNFLLTPEGITFLYNAYEIGPYVMGPIELMIPYAAIPELIKKKWRSRGIAIP